LTGVTAWRNSPGGGEGMLGRGGGPELAGVRGQAHVVHVTALSQVPGFARPRRCGRPTGSGARADRHQSTLLSVVAGLLPCSQHAEWRAGRPIRICDPVIRNSYYSDRESLNRSARPGLLTALRRRARRRSHSCRPPRAGHPIHQATRPARPGRGGAGGVCGAAGSGMGSAFRDLGQEAECPLEGHVRLRPARPSLRWGPVTETIKP
jgi:hypothetical protein